MGDSNVSIEKHFLDKSADLATCVNPRTVIYLDTKFWIKLRDVRLGKPQEQADPALHAALLDGVVSRKMICPFAADIFSELLRAGDPAGRRIAAQLVDELSLGITLRTEAERVFTELEYFLQTRRKKIPTVPARDKMWTCPAYVVGFIGPENPSLDAATQLEIQKHFVDHLYSRGFSEMVGSFENKPAKARTPGLAEFLNKLNAQTAGTPNTFAKIYAEEFRAAVYHHFPTIENLLRIITESEMQIAFSEVDFANAKKGAPKIGAAIVANFESGQLDRELPTLVVRSGLCAAMRWDRSRRYKENDFHDHSHAAAALPYFDIFATERSLAHLATNQLKFDQLYGAKVVRTGAELLSLITAT